MRASSSLWPGAVGAPRVAGQGLTACAVLSHRPSQEQAARGTGAVQASGTSMGM